MTWKRYPGLGMWEGDCAPGISIDLVALQSDKAHGSSMDALL